MRNIERVGIETKSVARWLGDVGIPKNVHILSATGGFIEDEMVAIDIDMSDGRRMKWRKTARGFKITFSRTPE